MDCNEMDAEVGRRDFIRSAALLGGGVGTSALLLGACSEAAGPLANSSHDLITGRKWVQSTVFDPETGEFTSLEGFTDTPENVLGSDAEFSGYTIKLSGEIVSVVKSVDRHRAGTWTLHPLGGDLYQLKIGGVVQPSGGPPYQIHLVERMIPGTDVTVITGYSYDPDTGKRVCFNVSHDPIWFYVIVVLVILVFAEEAHGHDQGGGG
jgi:hypothetical protein